MSYGAAGTAYSTPFRKVQRQIRGSPFRLGKRVSVRILPPMSRMLFLRDIQVDIQMRCRGCGHEGVLARRDLERRFGPNYPVLSVAPHYRCSRCNSKDVESRPAQDAGVSFAAAAQPEDFSGALGALQGLLHAVRGESRTENDVQDLMDDDLRAPMPEKPEAPLEDTHEDEPEDQRAVEVDAFEELLAKLTPARSYDEDEDEDENEEPDASPEPEPEPEAEPVEPPSQPSPDDTLAALHALIAGPGAEDEDEDLRGYVLDEPPDAGDDVPDELSEDLDDIPDEEIVSFAIRDPDARDVPDVEDEPDDDPESEEEADLIPFRRPPGPGSLSESLAALRALVEKAAADEPEAEPGHRQPARHDRKPLEPKNLEPEDLEPSPADDEDDELEDVPQPFAAPPVKTAQEKSLEETLAQLRGMLDLDQATEAKDKPVPKPRRR